MNGLKSLKSLNRYLLFNNLLTLKLSIMSEDEDICAMFNFS